MYLIRQMSILLLAQKIILLASSMSWAQGGLAACQEAQEAHAISMFSDAVQYAQSLTEAHIPIHLRALRRLRSQFTASDITALQVANELQEDLPPSVEAKLLTAQRGFNSVRCLTGERAIETVDAGLMCRRIGVARSEESRDDDEYPVLVAELYIDGYSLTACTELVSRESTPGPSVDTRFCTKMDVESRELRGTGLSEAIDSLVMEDEVFAYIGDIRLDDGMEHFVSAWVQGHCGAERGDL